MAYVSATPEQVAKWAGLGGNTELSEVLGDMSEDPHRAAQIAQSILSLLATESMTRAQPD